MKIYVKTETGKTLYIEINKFYKVDSLTLKIEELEGIPTN
jgi:hypothetical protein